MDLIALFSDPAAWLALLTLIALEVVLGVDNLIFIAILSNKLPEHQQQRARRIGLALALIMRIGLLMLIGWLVTLQAPLFDLGLVGAPNEYGKPSFETAFSGRDLILLAWAGELSITPRRPAGRTQAWIGLLDTCDGWQGVVLPIGGEDVIALGVAEGPRVGELLARVEDWWEDGDYAAGRDDCLEKMKSLLRKN